MQQTNPLLPSELSAQIGSEIAIHFSVAAKEKKDHAIEESNGPEKCILVERLEGKTKWQPGTTTSDSQRSREQGTKEDKKESRWEMVTKVFNEAGVQIKERKTSWQKSFNKSHKRKD